MHKTLIAALILSAAAAYAAYAAAPSGTVLLQDAGKIQGVPVRKPTSNDHGKALIFDNNTGAFKLRQVQGGASFNIPSAGMNANSTQVVMGSDTRLGDPRTPLAHKSTHAAGGTDPLTPADISAATAAQGAKADSALQPNGSGVELTGITAEKVGARPVAHLTSYLPVNYYTDGSVDYHDEIQAWLNSGEKTLYAPGGIWRSDSTLTIPSGVEIFGDGAATVLDMSNMPVASSTNYAQPGMTLTGTVSAAAAATADIAQKAQSISVDSVPAGLAAGDLIWIASSSEPCIPGMSPAVPKGELLLVDTVPNSTTINLRGSTYFSYTLSASAVSVYKVNPVTANIHDLKIVFGGIGDHHTGVVSRYTRDVKIDRVTIEGAEEAGVIFKQSFNPVVADSNISGATSPYFASSPTYNSGYGILFADGSRGGGAYRNVLTNNKHGIAGGGAYPVTLTRIVGNTLTGNGRMMVSGGYSTSTFYPSLDCHEPTFGWTYEDNVTSGNYGGGMGLRGQNLTITGNRVVGNNGIGIEVIVYSTETSAAGPVITSNTVTDNSNYGISVNGNNYTTYDSATIAGNTVLRNKFAGVYLKQVNRVTLDGNTIKDSLTSVGNLPATGGTCPAVDAYTVSDLTITGGTLSGVGQLAVRATGDAHVSLTGVNYRETTGLSVSSTADVANSQGPSGVVNTAGATTLAGLAADVNIASPANNNLLQYQTSDNKWHNAATIAMANLPTTGTWGQASGGLNFGSTPSFLIDSTNKTVVYYYLPASSDSSVKPFVTRRKGNTSNSTGAQLNTNVVGAVEMEGWDGSNYRPSGWIKTVAKEDFSSTASGGKVVISTMTPGATATAGTSALMADTQYDRVTIDNTGVAVAGTVIGAQIISTVATGTAPLSVASTTEVANLKSSDSGKLNGQAASYYAPATSATLTTPTINGPTYGNTTSTTIDAGAVSLAKISSSGATSLTVNNMALGRYLSLKITSSGGGAISVSTMTPTWVSGAPATITAGKTSWFICEGTASNAADCVAVKENY